MLQKFLKIRKTNLLILILLTGTFSHAATPTPRKVVIRGGSPCGTNVCYRTVKQKGVGSEMVLKCLGGGPNVCAITRSGIDEDGNFYNHSDLTDYDYVQYNIGLNYSQFRILNDHVESGTHVWTTIDTEGIYHTYNVTWSKLIDSPVADFEIVIQAMP